MDGIRTGPSSLALRGALWHTAGEMSVCHDGTNGDGRLPLTAPPAGEQVPAPAGFLLPAAILFDLDDTLLQYTAAGEACWQELCERFAAPLGVPAPALLLAAVRRSAAWYWSDAERHRAGRLDMHAARRIIVRRACAALGIAPGASADEFADTFTVMREERAQPFAGAVDTLRDIRRAGVRLALVTNGSSTFQRRKIDRFDLERYFDAIFIEGELGFGKPDDRVFRRALAAVDTVPADACMVGDNLEWDIAPAGALGMQTAWVDHTAQGLPAESRIRPSRIIRSVTELLGAGVDRVSPARRSVD